GSEGVGVKGERARSVGEGVAVRIHPVRWSLVRAGIEQNVAGELEDWVAAVRIGRAQRRRRKPGAETRGARLRVVPRHPAVIAGGAGIVTGDVVGEVEAVRWRPHG